jgi:phosphoribosylglycinamide formyltransferase 1
VRVERLVVLVSGGGTNLQAIIDACRDKRINAEVTGVISSKPGVYAIQRAIDAGIPYEVIKRSDYANRQEHDDALMRAVKKLGGQAVVLAGYLSILGPEIIREYSIINIHPALIPSFCGNGFYGHHVHEAVLEYGAKVSGATVHFVDEGTDTGPIIMQKCVPVLDDDTPDTLAARILEVEHEILVESLRLFCDDNLEVCGRRVIVKQ